MFITASEIDNETKLELAKKIDHRSQMGDFTLGYAKKNEFWNTGERTSIRDQYSTFEGAQARIDDGIYEDAFVVNTAIVNNITNQPKRWTKEEIEYLRKGLWR
jgi:hypothetical protein